MNMQHQKGQSLERPPRRRAADATRIAGHPAEPAMCTSFACRTPSAWPLGGSPTTKDGLRVGRRLEPMTDQLTLMLLFGAGTLAGAMNAVAGGGTFVVLPVLVLAGLSPTVANASTTVALFPGTLASAWAYRDDVEQLEHARGWTLFALSVTGGLAGALLLLFTPERAFSAIIPWLLMLATITFAIGPRGATGLRRLGLHFGVRSIYAAQLVLGIYGGYFGGAVGLMMLSVWSLASTADLRALTPLRTIMVAATNGTAVFCFAAAGTVGWRQCLVVMAGGIVGGYAGARVASSLPNSVLRALILAISVITTLVFFTRTYLP